MDDIEAGTAAHREVSSLSAAEASSRTERILCLVMACVLAGILIIEVLLCLMPPVSRDALIHHLAIPKLWIRHGGFFETPWADFSYFPMNVDLLYLVPLLFGNDRVPAFIHLLFGWGTGYLVYRYLKNHAGRVWGLLGLLVFVSTPMVIRLSITAYVDLGMIFFTTASVLSYLRWRDGGYEDVKWLLLAAVCMGLAAGTKYNALISWLFLGGAVCFLYARDTGKQLQAIRWGAHLFPGCPCRGLAVAGEKPHPEGKPDLSPPGQRVLRLSMAAVNPLHSLRPAMRRKVGATVSSGTGRSCTGKRSGRSCSCRSGSFSKAAITPRSTSTVS